MDGSSFERLRIAAAECAEEQGVEVKVSFGFSVKPTEKAVARAARGSQQKTEEEVIKLATEIHDLDESCREIMREKWITVSRAAEYWDLPDADPEREVRAMISRGELYAEREGQRKWKISAASCVLRRHGVKDPRLEK